MSKRFTMVLDDDNLEKLCKKQAILIKKSLKNISMSRVINDTIREIYVELFPRIRRFIP